MSVKLIDGEEFYDAPEVGDLVGKLVPMHHHHLIGRRIECVFLAKTPKKGGRTVMGRAKVIQGLGSYLAGEAGDRFGVIEIAAEEWAQLNAKQRRALVDHELCHFIIDEDADGDPLKTIAHDVEEFTDVVRRHGLWKTDLTHFTSVAVEQLSLLPEASPREAASFSADLLRNVDLNELQAQMRRAGHDVTITMHRPMP